MMDEHGMPLPGDESPLPWRLCGVVEIMASNEVYVSEFGESPGDMDVEFIVHAANHIIPCRDIVRRLAENEEMTADQWVHLIVDAKELWSEMQREKGGDK